MNIQKRMLEVMVFAVALPAFADSVLIPNQNFTDTTNSGHIGGGILNPSNTALIGTGPWEGTYNGALGVLAPPVLTIDDESTGGTATISGIAGINVLGLVNNSGWIQQTLAATPYAANTTYTLTADINANTLLTVDALDSYGAGIALLNNNSLLASSADSTQLVSIVALGDLDDYQLSLTISTGATAPSGNIGIRLFDTPSGLLSANLLADVQFSNINLTDSPNGGSGGGGTATPEPRETFLTGLVMVLVVGLWKKYQKKTRIANAASVIA
jgi:hypothetical protein